MFVLILRERAPGSTPTVAGRSGTSRISCSEKRSALIYDLKNNPRLAGGGCGGIPAEKTQIVCLLNDLVVETHSEARGLGPLRTPRSLTQKIRDS